jgi:hypothetical protein
MASIPRAQLEPIVVDGVSGSSREVIAVSFDVRVLRVTVDLVRTRDWVYMDFRFPRGFRVLDEGDLLEFWGGSHPPDCFLFQVKGGGWLDLEAKRAGFASTQRENVTEYLVASEMNCVSVLAIEPPQIAVCR